MGNEDETIRQAGEDIFALLGDDNATFQPKVGESKTVKAHIDKDTQNEPGDSPLQMSNPAITCEALLHECGQVPKHGDRFIVDSVTYEVIHLISNDGFFVLCSVKEI